MDNEEQNRTDNRIEAALREEKASPSQREAKRKAESQSILDDIHSSIEKAQHKCLPQSLTGRAVSPHVSNSAVFSIALTVNVKRYSLSVF